MILTRETRGASKAGQEDARRCAVSLVRTAKAASSSSSWGERPPLTPASRSRGEEEVDEKPPSQEAESDELAWAEEA